MDDDPSLDRPPKRRPTRPPQRPHEVNPNLSRQDIGQVSDAQVHAEWEAFHLRKRGLDPTVVNVAEFERKPPRGKDE